MTVKEAASKARVYEQTNKKTGANGTNETKDKAENVSGGMEGECDKKVRNKHLNREGIINLGRKLI